jgi:hypothetical protein
MLTLLVIEPIYARRMPRKVVSGPDYDDEYDDYEYDDDYDEYDDTGYGNNQQPVKTGKGMLPNLLAVPISPLMRWKYLLQLLHSLILTIRKCMVNVSLHHNSSVIAQIKLILFLPSACINFCLFCAQTADKLN